MCVIDIMKCHRCGGGFLTNIQCCQKMGLCQNVTTTFDRSILKGDTDDTNANVTVDEISKIVVTYIGVFGAKDANGKCMHCDDYPGFKKKKCRMDSHG